MPDLADWRDEDEVYQPAEDTRLLAEVARERVDAGECVLDVGTGSGFVGAVAAENDATVVGVDVNPHACRQARGQGLPVVRGNLTHPFRDGVFDTVLFNPPYLPTPPEVEGDDWQERALSGGADGRRVIEPFLADVGRVLAPDGSVLLLVSSLSGIEAVTDFAADRGLRATEAAAEKHAFERLVVLRLTPDPSV